MSDTGFAVVDPLTAPLVVPIPDPLQSPIEEQQAWSNLSEGGVPLAIGGFTRAVIHDPSRATPYAGLSEALFRARRAQPCAAACRSVLLREATDHATRARLGITTQMMGDFAESAAQWRQVIEFEPTFPDARARLAVLLYYLEEYAVAWAELHAAEAAGQNVPPQLRDRLLENLPEPP